MKASIFKQESEVLIPSQLGVIEALLGSGLGDVCAVICAPHPHFEGTMHNKIVATVTNLCLELSLNTLRFNHRGVGASSGGLPTYAAATQDIVFVTDFLKARGMQQFIWIGFSYGSYVAAYGSGLTKTLGLITIAPSVGNMPYSDLPEIDCPWHMLQGMDDEVIDIEANLNLAKDKGCKVYHFQETGHFFHGKLPVVRETISPILKGLLHD